MMFLPLLLVLLLCFCGSPPTASRPIDAPTENLVNPTCSAYPAIRRITAATTAQLNAAIADLRPGDVIGLPDNTTYAGGKTITRSGTAASRVVICGGRTSVINVGSLTWNGVYLKGADYITLYGFKVTNALTGVSGQDADFTVTDSVEVGGVGQAGMHFRHQSSDNLFRKVKIHDTGKGANVKQYGEGIYIGTAYEKWGTDNGGLPDRSDRNKIIDSDIGPNVTADLIDVKPGATGTIVRRVRGDGTGQFYVANNTPNWVNTSGNQTLVDSSVWVNGNYHGHRVYARLSGWGLGNAFRANTMTVGKAGYAIFREGGTVTVYCDNVRADPGKLSNVGCTP